jgi:ribosomal protein S18 acetylase RimI-like enzyme
VHRRRRGNRGRGGTGLIAKVSIRPAEARDSAAIGDLAESSEMFPAAMLDGMIAPFLAGEPETRWYVAEDGGQLVGFLYSRAEMLAEGTHNLLAMATAPEARGRGIGSALIAKLEESLSSDGQRVVLVETSSGEGFALTRDFYARRGFRQEASISDFWADGDDKVIFWKKIGPP